MEISEVMGIKDGEIELNPLYVFEESEESTMDNVIGELKRTKNPLKNTYKLKLMGYKGVI